MVVPIRDIGNISFHSLAFTTSASNMALVFNINMANDSIIGNIIYNDSDKKDKIRGCSSVFNTHSSRSSLVFLDKSTEEYATKVQHKSNSIDQDNPVIPSNSP